MGCGRDMRLGHGETKIDANQDTPRLVESLPEPAISVSVGEYHMAALTADGKLYTWGKRAVGHDNKRKGLPNRVEALSGVRVVAVSCGREHTAAIDSEGRVYTWGVSNNFATGHGSKADLSAPAQINPAAFQGAHA